MVKKVFVMILLSCVLSGCTSMVTKPVSVALGGVAGAVEALV